MRQLTQKEIDNAPDWADKYDVTFVSSGDLIGYYGDGKSWFKYNGGCGSKIHSCLKVPDYAKPIPRKEFDIHSVRLSDDNIDCLGHCDNKKLWTYFKDDTYYTSETREDIIAKAKHFKLTAEDLR